MARLREFHTKTFRYEAVIGRDLPRPLGAGRSKWAWIGIPVSHGRSIPNLTALGAGIAELLTISFFANRQKEKKKTRLREFNKKLSGTTL